MTYPVGAAPLGGKPEAVRVQLLGEFRVSIGNRIVVREWRLRKAGSLVKLLALERQHRLHREQIHDLLWPDLAPRSAANNLHRTLHVARKVLDPASSNARSPYLVFEGDLLSLSSDIPIWVDVDAFENAAAAARRSPKASTYRAALDLYAGDLLPEDRYESWAEDRRRELHSLYHALLVELAMLYEEQDAPAAAIETLHKVIAHDPTNEEAHLRLMRMLALKGRRQEALLQFRRLQQALSEGFDSEPGDQCKRLYGEIRGGTFPPALSLTEGTAEREPERASGTNNNLPHMRSTFVGRQQEMAEIRRSLAMTNMLTLTGAGGCGKTRLALEVARDLAGSYPDGVWLVRLASLSDPSLIPHAVASVVDVREQPGRSLVETLTDHLKSRRMLLVLDNCEHLIDACAQLADMLLDACTHLRILVTSREALGLAGELIWPVPPLDAPGEDSLVSLEVLPHYGAIHLFMDRARAKVPAFSLDQRNAQTVATICRKLDGIPLAIELAAARVTALDVKQIAARFEDSLDLLTSGDRTADRRHRTLRATLEWSYRLLSEQERALFSRLSVFTGGWALEAAESVGTGDGQSGSGVLDLLGRLVEKSLIVAETHAGEALRYRMLMPVRQYGRERLEQGDEAAQVRERHAGYYLALLEAAEIELMGPRPMACLEWMEAEYGNLRTALSWFLDENAASEAHAAMGLRLATALGRFWNTYGPAEGRRWLERGLALAAGAPPALRAKALGEAGFIAIFQGDPLAMSLLEDGLALSSELGDDSSLAFSVSSLGHAMAHAGDHARVATLREEAEALLRQPLDRRAKAHLLLFLAVAAMSQRHPEQVAVRSGEAVELFRELEDIKHVAMSLGVAGVSALEWGNAALAAELFEEDLRLLRELRDKTGIVYGLFGMAGVAALQAELGRAARLWGASEALREQFGLPLTPMVRDHYDYEGFLATARAGLDEAAFDRAWSEGRAMSPEHAVEYALGTEQLTALPAEQKPVWSTRARVPGITLTRRQMEVAAHVASGLSNSEIASELAISEHTVATHVRAILKKLDFSSRAQLAAWMTEQNTSSRG